MPRGFGYSWSDGEEVWRLGKKASCRQCCHSLTAPWRLQGRHLSTFIPSTEKDGQCLRIRVQDTILSCGLWQLTFRPWGEVGHLTTQEWIGNDWWWDAGHPLAYGCLESPFPIVGYHWQPQQGKGNLSSRHTDTICWWIGITNHGKMNDHCTQTIGKMKENNINMHWPQDRTACWIRGCRILSQAPRWGRGQEKVRRHRFVGVGKGGKRTASL